MSPLQTTDSRRPNLEIPPFDSYLTTVEGGRSPNGAHENGDGGVGDGRAFTADMRVYEVIDEIVCDSDTDATDDEAEQTPDEAEQTPDEAPPCKKRRASDAGLGKAGPHAGRPVGVPPAGVDDVRTETAVLSDHEVKPIAQTEKIVLVEKGQSRFEALPEGWVQVTHNSGMNVYLHKESRVCTLSRPYFLGPGSARKHHVPLNAVPCLYYKRVLDEEAARQEERWQSDLPNARTETIGENMEAQNLSPAQLHDYCLKLFRFKTISVLRFKSWAERRQYDKKKKQEERLRRLTLPDGTKPTRDGGGETTGQNSKKEWTLNPVGKSYVCILHEYVQHALKMQQTYKFTETEDAASPYTATVSINNMEYGVGYGTSKKQAKLEAARLTLEILVPEMRPEIAADAKAGESSTGKSQDQDLSVR